MFLSAASSVLYPKSLLHKRLITNILDRATKDTFGFSTYLKIGPIFLKGNFVSEKYIPLSEKGTSTFPTTVRDNFLVI